MASSVSNGFNDLTTADVVLRLYLDQSFPFDTDDSESQLAINSSSEFHGYLHSTTLRRSKYFSTLLSDRWKKDSGESDIDYFRFNLDVQSSAGSINNHVIVLQLLYSNDISSSIDTASTALELLPIALELLFEDSVTAYVKEFSGGKKGSFSQMLEDASAQNNNSGPNIQTSVPGNPVVSMASTNLNMGMDLWNPSLANGTMKDALVAIKGGRMPSPGSMPSFEEVKEIIGFNTYYEEVKRYATKTNQAVWQTGSSNPYGIHHQ